MTNLSLDRQLFDTILNCSQNPKGVIIQLLSQGANVNQGHPYRRKLMSPMGAMISHPDPTICFDVVEYLLTNANANPNFPCRITSHPLYLAMKKKDVALVSLLVNQGARWSGNSFVEPQDTQACEQIVLKTDRDIFTLILPVIQSGRILARCLSQLLETPGSHTITGRDLKVSGLLERIKAYPFPNDSILTHAIQLGDLTLIKRLLDEKIDLDVGPENLTWTALHDKTDSMDLLIQAGVSTKEAIHGLQQSQDIQNPRVFLKALNEGWLEIVQTSRPQGVSSSDLQRYLQLFQDNRLSTIGLVIKMRHLGAARLLIEQHSYANDLQQELQRSLEGPGVFQGNDLDWFLRVRGEIEGIDKQVLLKFLLSHSDGSLEEQVLRWKKLTLMGLETKKVYRNVENEQLKTALSPEIEGIIAAYQTIGLPFDSISKGLGVLFACFRKKIFHRFSQDNHSPRIDFRTLCRDELSAEIMMCIQAEAYKVTFMDNLDAKSTEKWPFSPDSLTAGFFKLMYQRFYLENTLLKELYEETFQPNRQPRSPVAQGLRS